MPRGELIKNIITLGKYKDDLAKDIAEASRIYGKGWCVHRCNKKQVYVARVINKADIATKTYVGSRNNFRDAIVLAVSESFKRGWLDWNKTVRYIKLRGYTITNEEITGTHKSNHQKGWYTEKNIQYKTGGEFYVMKIGTCKKEAKYLLVAISLKKCIEHALPIIKKQPFYCKTSSKVWLERKGLHELIKLL